MTNIASDASQMLAAAIEQMDGIIAGTTMQNMDYDNGPIVTHNQVNITHPTENGSHADVPRLVDELRFAAERAVENGEENFLRDRVEESTRQYIIRLLGDKKELSNDAGLNDKMKRLENDKESLQLQVNVLTDQLEVQNEKVEELEQAVAKQRRELNNAETKLLQESEIHCELEQSQQNYAMEASQLKARLDAVENETLVVRERAILAETKIEEQQEEMAQLLNKYQQTQKMVADLQIECHTWQEKFMETQALLDDLQSKQVRSLDEEVEKEKLKIAVDTLIVGNKEKDKTIDDLNRRLSRFYHIQDLAAMHGKVDVDMLLDIDHRRTDSVSTSSSATGETDTSKETRPSVQGSSPQSPERSLTNSVMADRTEEMFGDNASRRTASLENIKSALGSARNDPSPDHNPHDPTPDTHVTEHPTAATKIVTDYGTTVPSVEGDGSYLGSEESLGTSSSHETVPHDVVELTNEMSEYDSQRNKTPPFPVHHVNNGEAHQIIKRVNFDMDATTEIDRNSVAESIGDREVVDHVGIFLTQGATNKDSNRDTDNVFDQDEADLTFVEVDDQNMPYFLSDGSRISGHMTLPSPKKTTDPESELAAKTNPSGYRTLPSPRKNQEFHLPQHMQSRSTHGTPEHIRKPRASFGKGLFKIASKKTSSAPNLAMTEIDGEDALGVQRPRNVTFQSLERGGYPAPPGTPPMDNRRRKGGIKKLIGKLKRSGSSSLNSEDDDEDLQVGFSRNSRMRATAGPRLAWSKDLKKNGTNNDINAPFARWESDQVADWMSEMGLGQYSAACRVWVKNGGTLLGATPLEIEKYLGLKSPLHRKKLQLALQAKGSESEDKAGELDYHWVTRWLDDVGLPQYKDAFLEAKVDGRMLHYLTVDDLLLLKVTSAFHHVSIMRGIQCLRLNNFHPSCLRRRPTDEPYENGTQVMLWTNHRVMEWLRSVDLSEYAPNLRGSGVHGGLMVLEPRFQAETLALILCIPGNKTLLRRHLSTHFISLIGPDIQQQKREAEKEATFVPLNFLAKVKPKKRTFGKTRRGNELQDYVCPMDLGHPSAVNGAAHMNGRPPPPCYKVEVRSADKVHRQRDENGEAPEMQQGDSHNLGALSQEINSLTNRLSDSHRDRSTHV